MQSFGILVAAPTAAPTEGHAALPFEPTPPPAAVDACPEAVEDGVDIPVPPIAPGTEVGAVVPVGMKGADGAVVTLALPDNVPGTNSAVGFVVPADVAPTAFPSPRPGTFVAVLVPGKPEGPYRGEAF